MSQLPNNLSDDDAFETLLRSAMAARPEPYAPTNLSSRAIDLARSAIVGAAQRRAQLLARQRRWAYVTGLAAALLIGLLLTTAILKANARRDFAYLLSTSTTTAESTTAQASTDDATSAATSTDSSAWGISTTTVCAVVAGALGVAMALTTLTRAATPDSWGPDAAAGVW